MKRHVALVLAVVFAVGLVAAGADAQNFVGAFDAVTGARTDLAALYSNMPIEAGPSNVRVRTTEFTTEVQVALWSKGSFVGTKRKKSSSPTRPSCTRA